MTRLRRHTHTHTYYNNRLPNLKLWFIYTVPPHTHTHYTLVRKIQSDLFVCNYCYYHFKIVYFSMYTYIFVCMCCAYGENDHGTDTDTHVRRMGPALFPFNFSDAFHLCTNMCVCVVLCFVCDMGFSRLLLDWMLCHLLYICVRLHIVEC